MDYEGQKLAEILFYWIILAFGAVGWVIGYIQQDFVVVFYAWLVGVTLSVIVSPKAQTNSLFVQSTNHLSFNPTLQFRLLFLVSFYRRFAFPTGHFTIDIQ